VSVFDESIIYLSSSHAEEQLVARTGCSPENAQNEVVRLAYEGKLLIVVDDYRYIKNGDLFLPCIQYTGKPSNYYRVKSVLTWDMVDYRLQRIIDNYHLNKDA
jgi:hypothetical protein